MLHRKYESIHCLNYLKAFFLFKRIENKSKHIADVLFDCQQHITANGLNTKKIHMEAPRLSSIPSFIKKYENGDLNIHSAASLFNFHVRKLNFFKKEDVDLLANSLENEILMEKRVSETNYLISIKFFELDFKAQINLDFIFHHLRL
jgi:hypothetical protein